jgi:hypothetical protein
MIEQSVHLASNGSVQVSGYEQLARFGYTKNRGVYRLTVTATGEWEGLTIRCFWHVPDGKDPASSLVVDGSVDVPASVTAQPGNGCITFEGSDGTKTVTSADLRYRVSANSGTEDGTEPEPGTPAWQQLVDAVHTDATAAEQAKTDAQTAAQQAEESAQKAGKALSDTITAKEDALKAIGDKQTAATQAVDTARDKALQQMKDSTEAAKTAATQAVDTARDKALRQVEASTEAAQTAATQAVDTVRDKALQQVKASTEAAQTAANEAATSAGNADQSAQQAAGSLQELKDGIASGEFKGEPGNDGKSPVVTVTAIENGHRISITDKDGTKTIDVLNGKDGKDGTQIDDTTVGADAWSSKHIVDMLCPPLEESGNPVVCYPVSGYPLGCKVSWEPTQEGSGDPSPDNVRPIKGRDSVTVERCGENVIELFSTNDSSLGIKIAVDAEKNITLNGTLVGKGNIDIGMCRLHWVAGKTYTMYVKKVSGSASLGSGDGITFAYSLFTTDFDHYFRGNTTSTNLDAYIASNAALVETELIFMLQCWRDGTVFNNFKFQIEVVPGTIAPTTYAPYTGQTATLTLPRTIYGGTVDAVTGEGQETWKLLTLDGTENWMQDTSALYPYFVIEILHIGEISLTTLGAKCTAFPSVHISANNNNNGFDGWNTSLYIRWASLSTVDSLKSYLAAQYAAGTPVQVCYKLADPVPFTATGAQPIPALSGVNTVLTDADSATVTGRADPIKRITDLEDAVASMTTT